MRISLIIAVAVTLIVRPAMASPINYNIGPFFAADGDEILGTVAIANNKTVTSLTWEVLNGTQELASASSNSGSTIGGGGFTINGTSLLFPVLGNANIQYSTPSGGPTSPPTDYFQIFTFSDGTGDSRYGVEIEAGTNSFGFATFGGLWDVDTSSTPPTQPYLIATQAVPEPSSIALAITGLASLLFWTRRRMSPNSRVSI